MKQGNTIQEITKAFELAADADKAQQMAAYMKNRFSFYGIQKPMRQQITKTWIKSLSTLPFAQLEKLCLALWKKPQREFQYLVMDILLKAKPTASSIRLYEQLILQKSWWDTVDLIAAKMAGNYFRIYPEQKNKYIKKWRNSKNIWLIRSAILFQLKYKTETDFNLLSDIILQHQDSNEFFIQKAIGWVLREYAYTDAAKVKKLVQTLKLKPLSMREALKHLK